jgi:hypothetical protein
MPKKRQRENEERDLPTHSHSQLGTQGEPLFPWSGLVIRPDWLNTRCVFFLSTSRTFAHRSDLRPKRLNRGKGGAVAQLAAFSAQIRPDLMSKPSGATELHGEVPINPMAPTKLVSYPINLRSCACLKPL